MTHPHKELIIKLLDDPTLEVEIYKSGIWADVEVRGVPQIVAVLAAENCQFRIKEKPKPDVVLYFCKEYLMKKGREDFDAEDVLRLTFSADGTLKNAEVI